MSSLWRYIQKHKQYTENHLMQYVLIFCNVFQPCSRISSGDNNTIYTSRKHIILVCDVVLLSYLSDVYIVLLSLDETLEQGRNVLQ